MRAILVVCCSAGMLAGCGRGKETVGARSGERGNSREELNVSVDVNVSVTDGRSARGPGVGVTAPQAARTGSAPGGAAGDGFGGRSAGTPVEAKGTGRIELRLELPKEQHRGTPTPINIANLDTVPPTQRPPFLVPEGVINIAKGKPVTSSESFPLLGDLAMVTDGDKEGRDGSYVELGPGKQWVQIDLGAKCEMFAVVLWLYHVDRRAYHDVVVQVGDDAGMAAARIIYNNDHDNSSGFGVGQDLAYVESHMGRIIDAKGATGRYVRINSRGNTSDEMNHVTEVEIYGRASP